MNIIKIYKEQDEFPTYVIESVEVFDPIIYIELFDSCKEEIYIDEELIETKYHTK